MAGINYIFLLLSFGIVSTILSTPISAQTQNNSQNQTPETGGSSPYTSGKPGIESATEMEGLTNDTQTSVSNDTTSMMQGLGEETQAWGTKQQEDNKRTKQQEDNKRTKQQEDNKRTKQQEDNKRTKQQEDNKRTKQQGGQQGNQSEDILSKAGKALGDLFK